MPLKLECQILKEKGLTVPVYLAIARTIGALGFNPQMHTIRGDIGIGLRSQGRKLETAARSFGGGWNRGDRKHFRKK